MIRQDKCVMWYMWCVELQHAQRIVSGHFFNARCLSFMNCLCDKSNTLAMWFNKWSQTERHRLWFNEELDQNELNMAPAEERGKGGSLVKRRSNLHSQHIEKHALQAQASD